MYKHIFKNVITNYGITTSEYLLWNPFLDNIDQFIKNNLDKLKNLDTGGYIIKPVTGRGSLNVQYAKDLDELKKGYLRSSIELKLKL